MIWFSLKDQLVDRRLTVRLRAIARCLIRVVEPFPGPDARHNRRCSFRFPGESERGSKLSFEKKAPLQWHRDSQTDKFRNLLGNGPNCKAAMIVGPLRRALSLSWGLQKRDLRVIPRVLAFVP